MITPVNSIQIPDEFVEACHGWYSSSTDLLYAVCSTGNLTTGTIRPRGCNTDEKWYLTLWRQLSSDVGYAESCARGMIGGFDEDVDYAADAEVFGRFEEWVDAVCDTLCEEYGLENWEDN